MNTLLENYFLKFPDLDEKDRYEIRQIFNFVNDEKKQNILKNFEKMMESIIKLKKDLKQEQEILLWKAISNIERILKNAKISWIKTATFGSIWDLKKTI